VLTLCFQGLEEGEGGARDAAGDVGFEHFFGCGLCLWDYREGVWRAYGNLFCGLDECGLLSVRLGNEGRWEGESECRIVWVLVCQAKSQALLTFFPNPVRVYFKYYPSPGISLYQAFFIV